METIKNLAPAQANATKYFNTFTTINKRDVSESSHIVPVQTGKDGKILTSRRGVNNGYRTSYQAEPCSFLATM